MGQVSSTDSRAAAFLYCDKILFSPAAFRYADFLQLSNVSLSKRQAQDKQLSAVTGCNRPDFWRVWIVEAVDKKMARLNCIHHRLGQILYAEVEHEPKGDVCTGGVLKCDSCAKKGIVTW